MSHHLHGQLVQILHKFNFENSETQLSQILRQLKLKHQKTLKCRKFCDSSD